MIRKLAYLILSCSLLALVLGGCRRRPRATTPDPIYGQAAGQVAGQAGHSAALAQGPRIDTSNPREAIDQLDVALQNQGFRRVGDVLWNQNLAASALTAHEVPATPGACYIVAAIAAPSANLDLFVLGPDGNPIRADVNTNAHPWVSFCHSVPGRILARLQMTEGGGEYYYAVYQGSQTLDLSPLLDGVNAQGPAMAAIDEGTAARLRQLDQQQASERYLRAGAPHGLVYQPDDNREYALALEAGTCYRFAALGGAGAADVNLTLVDGGGNQMVADNQPRQDAMVQYCPPRPGAYKLQTRMQSGSGAAFTIAYTQQGNRSVATGAAEPVLSAQTQAGASLDENFRLVDGDMRARGYEHFGDSRRGELASGGHSDFAIRLDGGKCYAILAVGDAGVFDLGLALLDGNDREVDRDIATDPRPAVRVCPRSSGNHTMRVQMEQGQGQFIYAAYRWPRGTRGPFNLAGLIYVRLAEVTQLLMVEGYEPDVDSAPGRGQLAAEGQPHAHQISLKGGMCYSIAVVGGDGIHDLDVRLTQNGSELGVDGSRNAFPNVRTCPGSDGTFTLEASAARGAGEYFYQVFRRSS